MFYNRVSFKKAALAQLKGNWKTAALAGLTYVVIAFIWVALFFVWVGKADTTESETASFMFQFFLLWLCGCAVFSVLMFAMIRWGTVLAKEGKATFRDFIGGCTPKALGAFFWMLLWLFLWSLVLFAAMLPLELLSAFMMKAMLLSPLVLFPFMIVALGLLGFVSVVYTLKTVSYWMMFFALADKQDLSIRESMRIALKVTDGFRTNLFVTALSFIGWQLLCVFTLGIALIWVMPYFCQTFVNAWQFMLSEKTAELAPTAPRTADSTGQSLA